MTTISLSICMKINEYNVLFVVKTGVNRIKFSEKTTHERREEKKI